MSKEEKAIFTNMCMVYEDTADGTKNILVQDRLKEDWPGIAFPGGHVELKESFLQSVIREVKEETGLDIENPILCGIKHFHTKNDVRYIVIFFKTNQFKGTLTSSDEGEVFWINRNDLNKYKLSNDFEVMLNIFESETLSELYYYKDDGILKKNIF